MTGGQRLGLAIALVLLGGLSGFLAAHWVHDRAADTHAPAAPEPPRAAVLSPGGEAPGSAATPGISVRRIPERLPEVSLADGQGQVHSLSEWRGHPLMVNFWATWCEPCRREIPLLKKLRHDHRPEGLEVIGIAVDFADAVNRYSHQMGIDYPVLIGEQDGLDAIAALGMDAVFPFTVFADGQGRIVTLKVGELHPEEADLILARMSEVAHGGMDLAQAQRNIASGIAQLARERDAGAPAPATSAAR